MTELTLFHAIPSRGMIVHWMLEELNASYLKAGVFYVKNPNTLPRTLPATLAIVEQPTTIDAVSPV